MSVTLKCKNNTVFAFLKGEIDHHSAPQLREMIDDAVLNFEQAGELVLDFSDVTFMDSSGVGLVMGRYRTAASNGKTLRVENLSERDYRIMKMSGIEKIACVSRRN